MYWTRTATVCFPYRECGNFLNAYFSPAMTERPFTPGMHLTEIDVGENLLNYDSLLVYTHFKGHAMGGFGGSLKNIAIGYALRAGGQAADPRRRLA